MLNNTDKNSVKTLHPKVPHLNISKSINIKTTGKSLTQQEAEGLSASIVTDVELNVISISDLYFKLYGLVPLTLPVSLPKIASARKEAGWFALSEAFSGQDALEAHLHKCQTSEYFRDFHISSTGKIIEVTHYTDLESGTKVINFTPIGIKLVSTPETSIEVRGLMALRDLALSGTVDIFPTSLEFTQTERQTCALVICAPNSGNIIILDESQNFPELKNINHITDLSSDMQDIVHYLDVVGQYSCGVELEGSEPLQLVLKRQYFYKGGPSFLTGKLVNLWGDITVKSILTQFPIFSSKEAEVICFLAHGYTIKEAAAKTGKAQVTVSLQARSAQHKSGERSINALVARVTHSRLW
jgi:hypothetical protein